MFLSNTNTIIIGILIIGIIAALLWLFRQNRIEYEYTEDYLNNIAEYRDGTLTAISNVVIGELYHFAPEGGPKVNCYQTGEDRSLVKLLFGGDREVSFEVDWSRNKVFMVMQKVDTEPDANNRIIKSEIKFHLQKGMLVDKQIIVKAIQKWEKKIYDISKIHLDEILETVADTTAELQLTSEQRMNVVFSILEDVSKVIVRNRKCSKREKNTIASKLFAYVLSEYKDEFVKYIKTLQDEVVQESSKDEETIEK
jgi:hypothetical protein